MWMSTFTLDPITQTLAHWHFFCSVFAVRCGAVRFCSVSCRIMRDTATARGRSAEDTSGGRGSQPSFGSSHAGGLQLEFLQPACVRPVSAVRLLRAPLVCASCVRAGVLRFLFCHIDRPRCAGRLHIPSHNPKNDQHMYRNHDTRWHTHPDRCSKSF